MTTLVEILKQNKQYDKEKKDIASKLASFLETEKITKVLTETIEASTRNDTIEACVQVDNDYISLRVINSRAISFTVKEITEGNAPFIDLLDAKFRIFSSDKVEENDESRFMEFTLKGLYVEIYNYNSARLNSDKALCYLEKVIGAETKSEETNNK
jgi:hypothetical protein